MLDEVRTGLRLHGAGSWAPLGIRPDLSAWSKAIANGQALAAVTGTEALRDAAGRIFTTGSFWAGGVAMAAGLVTHLDRIGSLLRQGLAEQAAALGIGYPPDRAGANAAGAVRRRPGLGQGPGLLRRSTAPRRVPAPQAQHVPVWSPHRGADIALALRATEAGLQAVRRRFGTG